MNAPQTILLFGIGGLVLGLATALIGKESYAQENPRELSAKVAARLRSDGEQEMRRRLAEVEQSGAIYGPGRHHVLAEFQRYADEAKPARMRVIRETLGDREAEFRQGIAQEAMRILRNPPVRYEQPTQEQLDEGRREALAWARRR